MDYSKSKTITLTTGTAKLQTGTLKLIHVIDLKSYEKTLQELDLKIKNLVDENHPMHPFLSHEITGITSLLNRLKPKTKQKRSLNFLGSAWKWIAGSPDHDDFLILKAKINDILGNNNRQVIINKSIIERINNITDITNKIIDIYKTNDESKNILITNIKYKLDLIKEEIVNVDYALHWAKAGVVNSFILSNNEINLVKELFEKNNVPYLNLEDAIDFAEIKIASSNSTLLYIISIPNTELESCNSILMKPIKRGNFIVKIPFENYLQCEDKIYGIKEKCLTNNKVTICNNKQVVDLSNSNCIPNLLRSRPSNCTEIDNQHVPTVEDISPGTLLLNQYNGTILIDNETMDLTGTFIIQYHNVTLTIDKQLYISKEVSSTKPLPAVVQPDSSLRTYEEILTLEAMKQLHLKNTEHIGRIKEESRIGYLTNFGLTSIIIIFLITIILTRLIPHCRRESMNSKIEIKEIPLTIISEAGHNIPEQQGSQTSLAETTRINQIPLF